AFKLHMANSIVNQQNAGLSSMNTDQLLDLFDVSSPASAAPNPSASAASNAKSAGDAGSGSKSISRALEGLEELWDASQYEDEYNLDTFISSLQQ
ncbi:TATA-binding protein-associated factor mot1, partial [Coemansia sp. RSA 1939]